MSGSRGEEGHMQKEKWNTVINVREHRLPQNDKSPEGVQWEISWLGVQESLVN